MCYKSADVMTSKPFVRVEMQSQSHCIMGYSIQSTACSDTVHMTFESINDVKLLFQ